MLENYYENFLNIIHVCQINLFFYRAGVDDGSFQKVLDNEVRAIQRACQGNRNYSIKKKNFFFFK